MDSPFAKPISKTARQQAVIKESGRVQTNDAMVCRPRANGFLLTITLTSLQLDLCYEVCFQVWGANDLVTLKVYTLTTLIKLSQSSPISEQCIYRTILLFHISGTPA